MKIIGRSKNWLSEGQTATGTMARRDGMPATVYATFWFRPILAHCGSQRECRGEPKTCLQWPCESCRHEPASLAVTVDLVATVNW